MIISSKKHFKDFLNWEEGRKSLIRIEKSPFSWLRKRKARVTLLQKATEDSKEGKTKQRTKDQEIKTKKETPQKKHESSMNRLTPVQGPSAVACMIVTSLSQEATGRLSHATG